MSISSPFIHRRVATTLLTAAVALAGAVAFKLLPVAPLPQVDFPTICPGRAPISWPHRWPRRSNANSPVSQA
jgi:AcrB/AcrD/AcrF family